MAFVDVFVNNRMTQINEKSMKQIRSKPNINTFSLNYFCIEFLILEFMKQSVTSFYKNWDLE